MLYNVEIKVTDLRSGEDVKFEFDCNIAQVQTQTLPVNLPLGNGKVFTEESGMRDTSCYFGQCVEPSPVRIFKKLGD